MATLAKERVLVVDDEPQVLVALEDLLCDDFVILKTESAERALRLVEQERDIAVILSDQRMPKMTGDELFSKLDGHCRAARILVTGFADLSAVIRAVNNGKIFAYVTKPWNPEDLRLMVHKGADYFRIGKELAYERNLLHDLMDNVPDGIYFKDRDLRFLRANHSLATLLNGGNPDTLVGKRLLDLVPAEANAACTEEDERTILRDGKPALDVVRAFRQDGIPHWVSESKAPIRSPDGEIIGLVGISRDVTERVAIEAALRTSEERLQLMFQGSAAGLFDWNVMADEVSYSPSFGALLGYSETAWSESVCDLAARLHPDDVSRLHQALERHFQTRQPFNNLEVRARTRTGPFHWFLVSGQAVWDESGNATRLAGSITDITDRKVQEERIARLTRIHAVLSGINSAIVRTTDRASLIRESCRIAVDVGHLALAVVSAIEPSGTVRLMAWEKPDSPFMELVERTVHGRHLPQDGVIARLVSTRRPVIINELRAADAGPLSAEILAQGYRALAVFPLCVSGEVGYAFALFSAQTGFFDDEEAKLLGELADNISFALEHIARGERLDLLAYYDGLTKLPNRTLLQDRIAQQIATCQSEERKLAVLLVDIERFRQVNETLGRPAGDDLLAQVAERLRAIMAPQDTLARFDSKTFAVLIASLDDESDVALFVENRIQPALKASFTVEGTEIRISVRTGIALFPSDGEAPHTLIGHAETALKNTKSLGHKYLFYAPSMNARVAERLMLETKLRRAIENEEFVLFYQPKVDLKTGAIVGLEALIRWQDPASGLVSPGHFIPVLEDMGLILELGRWVLGHAAWQHADWVARGLNPPRIAVNVSALQLGRSDFVASLDALVAQYPLAGRGVDLEITESVFVDDLTKNAEKLREARQRGFQVAIDDFGTGYSSLGYLSRLPIDALKIDRTFVIQMAEDPQETAIVTAIISLAHSLDLTVVAEGVETTQQAHLLRLLRCDQIQGYLAAKPLPAGDMARVLGTTLLNLQAGQKP